MKKILLSGFALLILFSSCKNGSEVLQPDLMKSDKVVGVLMEQKNNVDYKGTHYLQTQSQDIPLRSVKFHLSDDKFLGNKVELEIISGKDGVFEVDSIKILTESEDKEKIKKLLYKNADLGFKISYFSNWAYTVENSKVLFYSDDNPAENILLIDQAQFNFDPDLLDSPGSDVTIAALNQFFSENYPDQDFDEGNLELIGENKLPALALNQNELTEYFLYRHGFIYSISLLNQKYQKQFNIALGTFDFLPFQEQVSSPIDSEESGDQVQEDIQNEILPIEGYTSFQSLPYSFQSIYPDQWYYAGVVSNENNSLHHYGFSDKPVTSENVIISLDIYKSYETPGEKLIFLDKELTIAKNSSVDVFTNLSDYTFRLRGPEQYLEIMKTMAANINPLTESSKS